MKVFGIVFLALYILMFLFGNIKVNGDPNPSVFMRACASAIGSFVLTAVIGLPICGILYLIRL